MYSSTDLMNMFSLCLDLDSTINPSKTIENIISHASNKDLIAIIGSHYWGEEIERIFKISLVKTQYKS